MARSPIELLNTPKTAQELFDQTLRNQQTYQIRNSNIKTTIDNPNPEITKTTDNIYNLDSGEQVGLIINTSSVVIGMAGTIIKATLIEADNIRNRSFEVLEDNVVVHVKNLHFLGKTFIGLGTSAFITTAPTVIYENCIFEQTSECLGKVHYIGCEFRDPTTSTIAGSGAANNYIIGCSRKGGVHIGGPTIISETT